MALSLHLERGLPTTVHKRMPVTAQAGGEPRCLMDFWAQRCLEEVDGAARGGVPPPGHASDHAMADTVMDFLFASQDASTASLVWTMCLMADHPDILQKVRAAGDGTWSRPSVGNCSSAERFGVPKCLPWMCLKAEAAGVPLAVKPTLDPRMVHMVWPEPVW